MKKSFDSDAFKHILIKLYTMGNIARLEHLNNAITPVADGTS